MSRTQAQAGPKQAGCSARGGDAAPPCGEELPHLMRFSMAWLCCCISSSTSRTDSSCRMAKLVHQGSVSEHDAASKADERRHSREHVHWLLARHPLQQLHDDRLIRQSMIWSHIVCRQGLRADVRHFPQQVVPTLPEHGCRPPLTPMDKIQLANGAGTVCCTACQPRTDGLLATGTLIRI